MTADVLSYFLSVPLTLILKRTHEFMQNHTAFNLLLVPSLGGEKPLNPYLFKIMLVLGEHRQKHYLLLQGFIAGLQFEEDRSWQQSRRQHSSC